MLYFRRMSSSNKWRFHCIAFSEAIITGKNALQEIFRSHLGQEAHKFVHNYRIFHFSIFSYYFHYLTQKSHATYKCTCLKASSMSTMPIPIKSHKHNTIPTLYNTQNHVKQNLVCKNGSYVVQKLVRVTTTSYNTVC